ncbi:MAG: hypothetical protein EHM45_07885 [Desulfobacteraceae bacterium]|nr:MAG: hypothetical protein EHM45_07885 [Desulfobacteraceae bacterium]
MNQQNATRLEITLQPKLLDLFLPIFQQGVWVRGMLGCTIRSFLNVCVKLDDDYVDRRIQTFFLNHKPVDNIDGALVQDQDTLALSTAMPGVLGAMLRKGGYYAAMRQSISQKDQQQSTAAHEGRVRLRLFNFLISEIGPNLLKQGIRIEEEHLRPCLENLAIRFRAQGLDIKVNGENKKIEEWHSIHWTKEVLLKVLEI